MFYAKYLVKDGDHFDPEQFPQLMTDLDSIRLSMASLPVAFNTEMLLSFLKERSIKTEWVNSNPALAAMISSQTLPTTGIEALFASSTANPSFQNQLEAYITSECKVIKIEV